MAGTTPKWEKIYTNSLSILKLLIIISIQSQAPNVTYTLSWYYFGSQFGGVFQKLNCHYNSRTFFQNMVDKYEYVIVIGS